MSKKSKGVILNSTPPFIGGMYEDAKARLKHQALMQDYQELLKDVDITRSKLDAAKQRKLILAAEVRFLRRRYEHLKKAKSMESSHEQKLLHPPLSYKQTKSMKEKLSSRKEAGQHRLPPIPRPKSKKRQASGKEVAARNASPVVDHSHKKVFPGGNEAFQHSLTPVSVLNHKGRINIRDETWNTTSFLDLNQNERMNRANDASLRKSVAAFDLNQDCGPSWREAPLPSRAPIFDLNEISTGDEDIPSNSEAMKFEESKKSLIRGLNDEQQNDLKLSICRNTGEGSSRVGKRKISWQDPVALRVCVEAPR